MSKSHADTRSVALDRPGRSWVGRGRRRRRMPPKTAGPTAMREKVYDKLSKAQEADRGRGLGQGLRLAGRRRANAGPGPPREGPALHRLRLHLLRPGEIRRERRRLREGPEAGEICPRPCAPAPCTPWASCTSTWRTTTMPPGHLEPGWTTPKIPAPTPTSCWARPTTSWAGRPMRAAAMPQGHRRGRGARHASPGELVRPAAGHLLRDSRTTRTCWTSWRSW